MSDLAFDTTKCNIPAIPKITELQLQDCNVPIAIPPIKVPLITGITPALGQLPVGVTTQQSLSAGQTTADIAYGATGTTNKYNCSVNAGTTQTITSRLTKIHKCDPVYMFNVDCGVEIASPPRTPVLFAGVLQSSLAAGSLTTPSSASVRLYVRSSTNFVSSSLVTALNYRSNITGSAGKTVLVMWVPGNCTDRYVILNVDTLPQSTATSTTIQSNGCCSGCLQSSELSGALYPSHYYVYMIPQQIGGNSAGIVKLVQVSAEVWESDNFNFRCAAGTDSYFWRLTTPSVSSCNDSSGAAKLLLVKNATTLHCPDLTILANTYHTGTTPSTFIYENIAPFRYMCGNTMYLNNDVCLPDALQTYGKSPICIYPFWSSSINPATPGVRPGPTT